MEYLPVCTVLLYFLPVHYPLITSANWRKLPKLGSQTISPRTAAYDFLGVLISTVCTLNRFHGLKI